MNVHAIETRCSISETFDRLEDDDVAPFLEAHRHELGDEFVETTMQTYRLYMLGVCCRPRIPAPALAASGFGF
ncbi:MAG: hypothetical protein AAB541_00165 [Patescibacteria group bacterium]